MSDPTPAPGGRESRAGVPLSIVLLATAVAVLAAALVVSVLSDDGSDPAPTLVLDESGALDPPPLVDPDSDPTGAAAPEFTLERIDGGAETSFSEYRAGRPVVVNFFASWCAPCVAEMPDIEEVFGEVGDEVAFLGLAVQEPDADTQELIEETGVTYDVAADSNRDIVVAFQGLAMPTTAFVAADGTITSVHSGQLDADALRARIDDELR